MPLGAVDACVWGYPLVLFDAAARRNVQGHNAALTGVTPPNDDLSVRTAWVDLREGPVALAIDETTRYYSISLFDAWGRSFASLGTRTTGNDRQVYAIVPPLWSGTAPHGVRTIEAPTHRLAVAGQTAKGDGDIVALQFSLVPIGPRANRDDIITDSAFGVPPESIAGEIMRGGGQSFLACLRRLLVESGRYPNAATWRSAIDDASLKDPAELDDDVATAITLIESELPISGPVDGWQAQRTVDARGSAYLERARLCRFHFLAGDEQDVFHRFARFDDTGRPLHGQFSYRLHFDAWNEPPARAFWSLAACDERFRAFPDGANNSSIRSRDSLVRNSDDSLDISIQAAPPNEPNLNWLAVPEEAFGLILRLYWPRPAALNGLWSPPALHAVGAGRSIRTRSIFPEPQRV